MCISCTYVVFHVYIKRIILMPETPIKTLEIRRQWRIVTHWWWRFKWQNKERIKSLTMAIQYYMRFWTCNIKSQLNSKPMRVAWKAAIRHETLFKCKTQRVNCYDQSVMWERKHVLKKSYSSSTWLGEIREKVIEYKRGVKSGNDHAINYRNTIPSDNKNHDRTIESKRNKIGK
jgi:hypothetical protein